MKNKPCDRGTEQRTFDIFVTSPTGSARYIESVESLAVARQRLNQLGRGAAGDCFIVSEETGIVELIVHPE